MSTGMTFDDVAAARGRPVFAAGGERVGDVEAIYYDHATRQPEWIGIGTGFIDTKRVLVPVDSASLAGEGVHVAHDRATIAAAPDIGGDDISEEQERELYAHYGLEPPVSPTQETMVDAPAGADEPRPLGVVRHEEELQVGKRPVEAGAVRLRKWVETEPVSIDVELQRETARVVREPIEQVVEDGVIGEQEIEMPIHHEEPFVQKQTIAKERVVLEKSVEVETHRVEDELRKERVDVDGPEPAS